ncbi:MAG: hypothetical protein MMC33_000410 [Icmadophila ericetorum]|nr:hypothetical protein [Icmadophila ericetorum]
MDRATHAHAPSVRATVIQISEPELRLATVWFAVIGTEPGVEVADGIGTASVNVIVGAAVAKLVLTEPGEVREPDYGVTGNDDALEDRAIRSL